MTVYGPLCLEIPARNSGQVTFVTHLGTIIDTPARDDLKSPPLHA